MINLAVILLNTHLLFSSIKCQKMVKNVRADVFRCRLLSNYQQKTQSYQFTNIYDKEQNTIRTFKKLEPAHIICQAID